MNTEKPDKITLHPSQDAWSFVVFVGKLLKFRKYFVLLPYELKTTGHSKNKIYTIIYITPNRMCAKGLSYTHSWCYHSDAFQNDDEGAPGILFCSDNFSNNFKILNDEMEIEYY